MKVKCSTVYGALTETASHRTHCELAWPAHTPELPASCFSARCDGLGALYIGDLLYDTLPLFIMSTPTYITMLDTANHHLPGPPEQPLENLAKGLLYSLWR